MKNFEIIVFEILLSVHLNF